MVDWLSGYWISWNWLMKNHIHNNFAWSFRPDVIQLFYVETSFINVCFTITTSEIAVTNTHNNVEETFKRLLCTSKFKWNFNRVSSL